MFCVLFSHGNYDSQDKIRQHFQQAVLVHGPSQFRVIFKEKEGPPHNSVEEPQILLLLLLSRWYQVSLESLHTTIDQVHREGDSNCLLRWTGLAEASCITSGHETAPGDCPMEPGYLSERQLTWRVHAVRTWGKAAVRDQTEFLASRSEEWEQFNWDGLS